MNTLTQERVRHLTGGGLDRLAEAILFYIDSLDIVPDSGLYGDPQASLHVVALEMNRRHGHASMQELDQVAHAVVILEQSDQLLDGWASDMHVNWRQVHISRARAFGVLVDHGPTEVDWVNEEMAGYSWQGVRDGLEALALREGRARGFDHAPVQPERFIPVDAGVPPF